MFNEIESKDTVHFRNFLSGVTYFCMTSDVIELL